MKVEGALWKLFYNDEGFWEGHFHDDTLITFDGIEQQDYENPAPGSVVKIEAGYVYKHSDGYPCVSLTSFFRKWKKIQTTTVIVVTVNKDAADSVRHEIGKLGGIVGVE